MEMSKPSQGNYKIRRKRPILHPPIPSPYAGADKPKIVYISTKTPFISAVKRVQKLISLAEKRLMGKVELVNGTATDSQKLKALDAAAAAPSKRQKESEAVILKATNKAIEKVLNLARFFQCQEGLNVQLRTGTVGVVDDILHDNKGEGMDKEEEELVEQPDSQIRKISKLEVSIMLK